MHITICDIVESSSPWITFIACCVRTKKNKKDNVILYSLFFFAAIGFLNIYAVYLGSNRYNNIPVYTFEHLFILAFFSYISFKIIRERFKWFFISGLLGFIGLLIYQKDSFDRLHSINPFLSGFFSYMLILNGLITLTLLFKQKCNIKMGYYQFSIWYAASLILYFVSIFLLYTFFDLLQLLDKNTTDILWEISTFSLLLFFIMLSIAYTRLENLKKIWNQH
jgi:hypothetical protein